MDKFQSIFGTDEKEKLVQLTDAKQRTDDGCVFDVHRLTLARKCDYFYGLFCGFKGEDRRDFSIPDVSGESLSDILIYLYTNRSCVNDKNVTDLMVATNYLLVDGLFQEIRKSAQNLVNINNCVLLLVSSYLINCEYIYEEAFHFVENHFESVVKHCKELFADLPFEVLKCLLCRKTLCVPHERPVWEVISVWVQKDIKTRLTHLPDLLSLLARKGIHQSLATEILGHSIVENNSHLMIKDSCQSGPIHHILHSIIPISQFEYRIPSKLYLVAKAVYQNGGFCQDIYVMNVENFKWWRKIASVDDCTYPFDQHSLKVMKQNVYILQGKSCLKFDLKETYVICEENITGEMSVEHVSGRFHYVIHFGQLLFFIGSAFNSPNSVREVKMFDSELNSWKDCRPCLDMKAMRAASVSKYIYVVGKTHNDDTMTAQRYNTESDEWSQIPPPKSFPSSFIGYHKKLVIIANKNEDDYVLRTRKQSVEIYDPVGKNWRDFPDLPITLYWPTAIILNDRLLVCEATLRDDDAKRNILVLNEAEETWEEVNKSFSLSNLYMYRFFEIDDVETIRLISKSHKYRSIEWQRSDINWNQPQLADDSSFSLFPK